MQAQCTEIFISEYRGWHGNKGVEFYNPTGEASTSQHTKLQRWSNGEGTATDWTDLIGTIEPHGTWVLVNGQTEAGLGRWRYFTGRDPAMRPMPTNWTTHTPLQRT